MLIAIDYDETWSKDPSFWRRFCNLARSCGHKVIMVTNRQGDSGDVRELRVLRTSVTEIIFAQEGPKRNAARARGYRPHIWIDDKPSTVDHGL